MNKKVLIIVSMIIILLAICGVIFCISNKEEEGENKMDKNSKILVVYYSAQTHTEKVAKVLADNLNADIFEIVPVNKYSDDDLDWTDRNSRVSKEHDDESLRNIELENTNVNNWDDYDTILIGYPIWWGIAAWPVNNFVKNNNFEGKNIIPFCTSSSSGIGDSGKILADLAGSGTWQDGKRFNSNASEDDIKKWIDSLE